MDNMMVHSSSWLLASLSRFIRSFSRALTGDERREWVVPEFSGNIIIIVPLLKVAGAVARSPLTTLYSSIGGGMLKSGAVLSRGNRIINPRRRSHAGGICCDV